MNMVYFKMVTQYLHSSEFISPKKLLNTKHDQQHGQLQNTLKYKIKIYLIIRIQAIKLSCDQRI